MPETAFFQYSFGSYPTKEKKKKQASLELQRPSHVN